MALETATYISGLNSSNPVGATDPKSQGDDHLRLIKSTLLNTFPNITGAMTASHTELNLLDGVTGKTGTGNLVLSASPTFTGTLTAAAITASGTITGNLFSGSGASLTSLNASNLSTGSVPNARITAGNITQHVGSIDHDALLNFVANEHINHANVSITAGNGLTGGGTIAATRTLNVGAGDGISVSANAVAVDNTVVRTSGAQTIGGAKTFSSAATFSNNITMSGTRTIDATTRLNLTGGIVSVGENNGTLGFFGAEGTTKRTVSGTGDELGTLARSIATALQSMGLVTFQTS